MKKRPFLGLIALCMLVFSACKKDISTPKDSFQQNSSGIHVSLTKQQAIDLVAILKKGNIKDSAAFLSAVNSVQLKHPDRSIVASSSTKHATDYADGSEVYGDDELNDGFFVYGSGDGGLDDLWSDYPPDFIPSRVYKGTYERVLTFTRRGNTVRVIIPYCAALVIDESNQWTVGEVYRNTTMTNVIAPTGGGWGTMTPSLLNNWLNSDGTNSATAHSEATEVRTQVFSTAGTFKISTNADASFFKVGAEISAGFTVSSSMNIYNQYTMEGVIMVNADGTGYSGTSQINPPIVWTTGSVYCLDTGLIMN